MSNALGKLTVGSLFAGIGGIELGLEWTGGFETVWQVEIDDYARRVLEKHWPNVRRWDDVRTFPPEPVDEWRCDLVCGGFPCQDISDAGKGAGIDGSRSGLWSEFARVVRTLRPRYVLVENVAALLRRGVGRVLGDLAQSGYDAEWSVLPAASYGAYHRRERLFLLAYPYQERWILTYDKANGNEVADWKADNFWQSKRQTGNGKVGRLRMDLVERCAQLGICPVVYGVPSRLDEQRIECLGNAVVPQVAQWIGQRILEAEKASRAAT